MLALFMVLTPVLFYGQNAKMWRQFDKVDVISSSPVLTEKGGMVEVSFEVVVPGGYFAKNSAMFVQPELRYKNGMIALKPLTLKGEEVSGDGVTISHKDGGSYTYTDLVKYDPKLNWSELYVVSTVYMGKEGTLATIEEIMDNPHSYECCNRLVTNGVIYTSERLLKNMKLAESAFEFTPKEVISPKEAIIYFIVNRYDVRWDIPLNKDNNTEAKFNELVDFAKKGWKIKSISIDGWASPEGISVNDKLSENRANTMYDEVIKRLNQMKADGVGQLSFTDPSKDIEYLFSFNGSDWNGFMADLEASNLKDKKAIADAINNADTEVAKDRALRNSMYKYAGVRGILAPLRRTEVAINYVEPYKSKEEITALAKTNPGSLELKELLFAAENADGDQKLETYNFIIEKFPNCWMSKNNAAVIYANEGNYAKAGELLNKAHEMYPDQGIVNANLGALAIYKGDFEKADEFFANAKANGAEVDNYNMGVLAIVKGDYKEAADLLSAYSCDFNAGLAQLLAEDYATAEATLKCIEQAPC